MEQKPTTSQSLIPNLQPPTPTLQTPNLQYPGGHTSPIPNLKLYLALALLLLLYLLTALAYATLAPLTTGPDELAHYEYVRFIAEHGRLPLSTEERAQASYKSDQPPLYHLLAAIPASLVDPSGPPFLKRVSDHPRRQLIERTRHAWGLYNTEDEGWPFKAEVLRWQVGRWVAILFGAATVALTFFIARDVFKVTADGRPQTADSRPAIEDRRPAQPLIHHSSFTIHHSQFLLPLAAAAIVAFIPRYGLTGSMLNYETTLAFFASLFLWTLIRFTIYDLRFTINKPGNTPQTIRFISYAFFLGLFAGLSILTKLSALLLPLEAVVGLWLILRMTHHTTPWKLWLRGVLITVVTTLAVISPWFGFVLYRFNTVAADGWWTGLLRPLVAADTSDATTNQLLNLLTGGQAGFTGAIENLESGPPWEWAQVFFRTLWLVPIETVQPLDPWALLIVLALCLMAAAGLVIIMIADHRRPTTKTTTDSLPLTTDHWSLPTSYSRLLILLLLLHLITPLILPLLRYVVTFSLADTAQGRHILFLAAPALAILLVWGLVSFAFNLQRSMFNDQRLIFNLSPLIVLGLILVLVTWTIAHLWTMTWAYHPVLPVSTRPPQETQMAHRLELPLNEFVTLLGYSHQYHPESALVQVDLYWQAAAISPVDYLTQVNLLDEQGQNQASWLGYSANGRYPTRAWDVGDTVRDTIWLPIAHLPAGQYQLQLNLKPTAQSLPDRPLPTLPAPITPGSITLPAPLLPAALASVSALDSAKTDPYTLWQNGLPLTEARPFRERETILVTVNPHLSNLPQNLQLTQADAALDSGPVFTPTVQSKYQAIFIVDPAWPPGSYALRATGPNGQFYQGGPWVVITDLWQRNFAKPSISHPIEANFADQVKLLGYDLGANRAEPGGGIPLTLYWQGLDWMGSDYTIFTKLMKADDQSVHGGRDRLPREGYRTLYWAPGEIITDAFGLPVDPDAPNGIYLINLGWYKEFNRQAVSLPLMQEGQPQEATSVTLGPVKIGRTPPGLTVTQATPQYPLNQPLGDSPALILLGYDLTQSLRPSDGQSNLQLTLYWRSESPLPLNYTTFVHLRNAAGETVAQKDQPPLNGAYPTSLWEPGEIIADEITIPIPDNLPAGSYSLVTGLYDFQTGQRLTVPHNPANEVKLTDVEIP